MNEIREDRVMPQMAQESAQVPMDDVDEAPQIERSTTMPPEVARSLSGTLKKSVNKMAWRELHDEEKIERLRGIVKDQQGIINRLCSYMDQLVDHQHFEGHIVKQVLHSNDMGYDNGFKASIRSRPDEWI